MTLRDGAVSVVQTLVDAGYRALWAGGCVRDQLLGRVPKDYDVATNATPDQVMACFERTIPVGVQFGVVRVLLGDHEYEIATFRVEGGYQDGRRPTTVRWAGARDDVMRRDFTINGLLFDPLDDSLHDFVGGQQDLKLRVIRAIGNPVDRFTEDKLRLLRAARFAARMDFEIERETWRALCHQASEISEVSVERIADELLRILTEAGSRRGLMLLAESGLGQAIAPELDWEQAANRFPAPSEGTGAQLARVKRDRAAGLANLLLHCDARSIDAFGKRMKLPRALVATCLDAVELLRELPAISSPSLADRKRARRRRGAAAAHAVSLDNRQAGAAEPSAWAAFRADAGRWDEAELTPALPLSGRELRAAGFQPGPAFKVALEALETYVLNAEEPVTADAAWAVVKPLLDA